MRVAVVLGTRPEIIKLSPLLAALALSGDDLLFVHTGQHYAPELDAVFFGELELPEPTVRLDLGPQGPAGRLARVVDLVAAELVRHRPDVVVVQGDTNSGLAGALGASRLGIPLAHVEAGLRSQDRRMPEEANRRTIDALASLLFAPTEVARANLLAEGVGEVGPAGLVGSAGSAGFAGFAGRAFVRHVEVTGNTVVDAMHRALALPSLANDIVTDLGLAPGRYSLVTSHRAENLADPVFLRALVSALEALERRGLRPVWPVHPRARQVLGEHGLLARADAVALLRPPLGYRNSLALQQRAGLVLTDSGGVQEEACVLGVPCVVARRSSDRPEAIAVGAGVLGGTTAAGLEAAIDTALVLERDWLHPFGDGLATLRILNALTTHFD